MQWSAALGRLVPANGTAPTDTEAQYGPPTIIEIDEPPRTKPALRLPPNTKPKNIVALAKARLKDVKAELRRMKALEKECAELERLIQAAENKKSRPSLRAVKSAG